MRTDKTNITLHRDNLVNYDPKNIRVFQWPIQDSFLPELTKAMEGCETAIAHLVSSEQPEPIVGYIKSLDGKLYFQLELTTQIAESVIPRVPDHVRRRMLEQA